jgi:hypothetical protein
MTAMNPKSRCSAASFSFLTLILMMLATSQAKADALYNELLSATPQSLPQGFTSPIVSAGFVEEVDKNDGIIGNIQIIFQGDDPTAKVTYLFFSSPEETKSYSIRMSQQIIMSGSERKTIANLPDANCADAQQRSNCYMVIDQLLVVTSASNVESGAAPLLGMAVDHLNSIKKSVNIAQTSQTAVLESTGPDSNDPCKLVTKSDAEAALGQPVHEPRRDSANSCFYGSKSNPGDSVMIQLIDGGQQKLEFDRSRMSKLLEVTGIGDIAFAFVSPGGFVQLSLVKNNRYMALVVNKRKDSKLLDSTKVLATKVASRLP